MKADETVDLPALRARVEQLATWCVDYQPITPARYGAEGRPICAKCEKSETAHLFRLLLAYIEAHQGEMDDKLKAAELATIAAEDASLFHEARADALQVERDIAVHQLEAQMRIAEQAIQARNSAIANNQIPHTRAKLEAAEARADALAAQLAALQPYVKHTKGCATSVSGKRWCGFTYGAWGWMSGPCDGITSTLPSYYGQCRGHLDRCTCGLTTILEPDRPQTAEARIDDAPGDGS